MLYTAQASDPRVQIHVRGQCSTTASCDVCGIQRTFAPAIPTLIRLVAGRESYDALTMPGLPPNLSDQAEAGREAAAGALHVLIEQNADNASRAVGAGALLELAELMGKGGTAASRIEAATAVHSIAYIGGPATRLKAVQAGVLHPVLEMVEQSGASDAIMLLANTPGERKRVQVWDSEAAQADVLEAYKAGAKLLACLAVEEENRLAIAVSRPKAIDPIVKMTRRDAIMPTQVESEDEMSIVLEAQEWACVALGYLCQVPKLHFLLLAAEVVPALVDVARDVDTATTNARLGALRGLAGLSTRSLQWEERAVGSVPVADEIQRSLMQQGVLAMAMFVVDSSPDMPLKIAAADICAGLADLVQGMGADREREVLALKMPLVNMKQTSPSQEARDAADKALGTLTALEGRLARSWVGNNFGQTVQPAPYAMGITAGAGTEDMDQLD
ncbi:hypothetical protein CYMTET_31672 [Cymbomonas tetramitiformis]|uniref:Uncharacterized protein n=1 Tax=Cymbomonas tetramitiformis TaxID=36881 RepID=A0AAE0KSY3_9CHLO|nr:hypothetical protein CYMTET_31672 [Cymbomonas tetramitiformis]